jgi:hypothetical protein
LQDHGYTEELMHTAKLRAAIVFASALLAVSSGIIAQTHGDREEFTAVAIANNNIQTGAGTVLISIERWSTNAERERFASTLMNKGPRALIDMLQDTRPVGRIRTPDSLGYDLRYAHQTPGEDGGRRIVIATDRPIGFWEAYNRPRTVDYPFTIVQMQIGPDGRGTGTLSEFTKVLASGDNIYLENFASAPVMLTDIRSNKDSD